MSGHLHHPVTLTVTGPGCAADEVVELESVECANCLGEGFVEIVYFSVAHREEFTREEPCEQCCGADDAARETADEIRADRDGAWL